jgi:hypothetical protein
VSGRGGGRAWGTGLLVVLTGMGLMFLAFVLDEGRMFDNPLPLATAIAGAAIYAALFFGPVGKAIARMLDSDGRPDDESTMRLEDVESRVAELTLEQHRMAELEDRLDFTERLLSQAALTDGRKSPERP